jgi:hypothetical protein
MLHPFIIDEIRRLEEAKRQQRQPHLELELPRPIIPRTQDEPEDERGVYAIDLL